MIELCSPLLGKLRFINSPSLVVTIKIFYIYMLKTLHVGLHLLRKKNVIHAQENVN